MFESKFFGKEPVKKPECPFCGTMIEHPRELSTRRAGEMPVGRCACGAVYACDETGHNLGSAMVEALVFGCNMDWDLAWGLDPDEDYIKEIVEHYDINSHLVIPSGTYEGRRIGGALYFVRLHQDVQEVTEEGVQRSIRHIVSDDEPKEKLDKASRLSKKEVETFIRENHVTPILDAVARDKKVIRFIQRLLYSGDDLLRFRTAEVLGQACAVVGRKDPAAVSKLLQGLFYSINDTAAYPLGAFEAIGEIISHKPDMFGGYIPQLYQFAADPARKAPAFQALGRISRDCSGLMRKHTLHFFEFLEDTDPVVRGNTALLLGNLGAHEALKDIEKLTTDAHEIELYESGKFLKKAVGRLAIEALEKIKSKDGGQKTEG